MAMLFRTGARPFELAHVTGIPTYSFEKNRGLFQQKSRASSTDWPEGECTIACNLALALGNCICSRLLEAPVHSSDMSPRV